MTRSYLQPTGSPDLFSVKITMERQWLLADRDTFLKKVRAQLRMALDLFHEERRHLLRGQTSGRVR